jgi:hypothetical protein
VPLARSTNWSKWDANDRHPFKRYTERVKLRTSAPGFHQEKPNGGQGIAGKENERQRKSTEVKPTLKIGQAPQPPIEVGAAQLLLRQAKKGAEKETLRKITEAKPHGAAQLLLRQAKKGAEKETPRKSTEAKPPKAVGAAQLLLRQTKKGC